jgi:hypothetical protein
MSKKKPDTKDELPLSVQLGATAKVAATAKYERTTDVSIVVPEDVTRDKANALLDAISPLTESLGLVGDWIAGARERLKIHRLQSLTVIAHKARQTLEDESKKAGQIPIKALLPILERASLEEPDDDVLTTAWGKLIASASSDYDPEVIAFSRILSELSPRECLVLEHIFGNRRDWILGDRSSGTMRKFFENEADIKPLIREAVLKNDPGLFNKLRMNYVEAALPMEFTVAVTRGVSERANWIDKTLKEPFYAENELGYTLLETQGLIASSGQSYSWQTGEIPVGVDWVILTDLGVRFVARVILQANKKQKS